MNVIASTLPIDLERLALQCGETPEFFADLKNNIFGKIKKYDAAFGTYMIEHLEKTSGEARLFLKEIGIDAKAADIIADAFSLHDAGKIMQRLELWAFSEEKPVRPAEQKFEREQHGALGVLVLNSALKALNIDPSDREKAFIMLTEQLMVLHHERMDGSGPQKMKVTDRALMALAIIDQIDGKGKVKTLTASFEDMSGKHEAQFCQDMVPQYRESCMRRNIVPTQPPKPVAEGLQI